jgi:hypothetical protein
MSFRVLLAFMLVALTGSGLHSQQLQKPAKPIWTGQNSGHIVCWTQSDLTVAASSDGAKTIFSAAVLAEKQFEDFKRENIEDNRNSICSYALTFRLLSVVGPLISYEETEDSYCRSAAGSWAWPHPSFETTYHVIDLNDPVKGVELTDLFSEGEILRALLGDPVVKKALGNRQTKKAPKTIAELVNLFELEGLSLEPLTGTAEAPKGCRFTLPNDILKQFAFHHLEDGKLAVRISLQPDVGACRTAHAQLGIVLPIPESLRGPLDLAQAGKEGFLMKDVRKIAGDRVTKFGFRVGDRGRRRRT